MQESSVKTLDPQQMAAEFVPLNRALAWGSTPEEWQPAAAAMHAFLDRVAATLALPDLAETWTDRQMAVLFGILMTVIAEAGQYRFEAFQPNPAEPVEVERRQVIVAQMFPLMGAVRDQAIDLAKAYLSLPVFASLADYIRVEIFPILDDLKLGRPSERYMPHRVIQVGNVIERLAGFSFRTEDPRLVGGEGRTGLLRALYDIKYLRFGTSGVRGRWGNDFTERRARQVVQAICEFLSNTEVPAYVKGEDLRGKRLVIGYDSRLNARTVADWATQVCLGNGFSVDLGNRDLPTPVLVYYLTDYLPEDEVAGLIILTASHNPPEWQGIKFNPRQGWSAPTNLTDFIAQRINELTLLDLPTPAMDLGEAYDAGRLRGFDPIDHYTHWVLDSGHGNGRVSIDPQRIRKFFDGKFVVIDEMHGAGRGYLSRLLGEIGVRHTVIHAEVDPRLPGLDYANPEEPFINLLKETVRDTGAEFGGGTDTDADRYGVVDKGGVYFRPNQVLPMLTRYLGVDRQINGRVIATQTGSPLLEVLAGQIPNNDAYKPAPNVIPAYVDHPFYHRLVGRREDQVSKHAFVVPVGIKYIEEQRRTDAAYRNLSPLPKGWRDRILIGGEESSGLTSKGHVTDKDGIWANLLIMDMLAYYGTRLEKPLLGLQAIWDDTCRLPGAWKSYGGRENEGSNSGRSDVDSILEVKEALINYYLDAFGPGKDNTLAGLEVIFAGGVRYDLLELRLRDSSGDDRHFLRMRASGTEPINRIYVESSRSETARRLMQAVLSKLEALTVDEIRRAQSEWRLADMLAYTAFSPAVLEAIRITVQEHPGWSLGGVAGRLRALVQAKGHLEGRNRRIAARWLEALG